MTLKPLRRSFFPLLAALTVPALAWADGSVTGIAYSKETGAPLDFATVQLLDAKGKPLTIGTMTDESGRFILENVPDGSYIVRISSVGSVDNERPVTIAGDSKDIGAVRLAEDSKLLQEVVVEGVRSQMRFELDRKIFQVDANVVAAGQSASELLESIPSVEVDQDGEVSLRGNSSVTVWINGKESGLTADNRAQILEQIPGDTIDRIEVITNPSAKYSPEGTSGIINIVLKQDRRAGYFGSADLTANSRGGGNLGFNINVNSGKWDTYASLGFRMRHGRRGSESQRTETTYWENGISGGDFLNQTSNSRNHGNNIFLRAGTTFHMTSKDDFYLNAFGMLGHRWGHTDTEYQRGWRNSIGASSIYSSEYQYSSNKNDNRGGHIELGYTHKWSDSHTIDAMVGYNFWGGPQHNYYEDVTRSTPLLYGRSGNMFDSEKPGYDYSERVQDQTIHVNSVEAKIDYTAQLADWLKLEAGYNGNYSYESTPVTGMMTGESGQLDIAPALYNKFIYRNDITALYFTLGGKVKKFSYSAGLRGEAWQIRTRSLDFEQMMMPLPAGVSDRNHLAPLYKKNNFALFPSVFLSYSLPYDNEVQINYTRRLRRPWGGQLNSFVNTSDPTRLEYGNPELEPQYSNSFELNYIKSWTDHLISFSGYFRTSDNVMNRLNFLWDGMMYSTNQNVSKEANSGCEIVVKNKLFRRLDLTTTINLFNNHVSAWTGQIQPPAGFIPEGYDPLTWGIVSGASRNSFAWNASLMAGLRLPWQLSVQATGRYNSKQLTAQGSRQGGWNVDAGIRKTFGDWSLSVNCRDIFDSRKFKNTIDGGYYVQHSKSWRNGRTFSVTLKYSFGSMKAKPNRQQQAEPMDGSGYGESMD